MTHPPLSRRGGLRFRSAGGVGHGRDRRRVGAAGPEGLHITEQSSTAGMLVATRLSFAHRVLLTPRRGRGAVLDDARARRPGRRARPDSCVPDDSLDDKLRNATRVPGNRLTPNARWYSIGAVVDGTPRSLSAEFQRNGQALETCCGRVGFRLVSIFVSSPLPRSSRTTISCRASSRIGRGRSADPVLLRLYVPCRAVIRGDRISA